MFSLAVGITILGVYAIVSPLVVLYQEKSKAAQGTSTSGWKVLLDSWEILWTWNWELFGWVSLGTLVVIALGCAVKYMEIDGGGTWVAELLGGRRLDPASPSQQAQMLCNIVEEVAIASGIAAPPIYILDDEQSINAFAAGHSLDDAVIGITRGTLDRLSREELQGVIAHEFSHILNGDMSLNLEMLGLLHGIQGIGLLGRFLIESSVRRSAYSRGYHHRPGGGALGIIIIGGAFMVVGSMGMFFASIIKAAISRQREYLADASSIQFTRCPQGLVSALKKIGGYTKQTAAMQHLRACEVSHMFFSQGLYSGLDSIFATHPPLVDRIQRIDPSFSVEEENIHPSIPATSSVTEGTTMSFSSGAIQSQAWPTNDSPSTTSGPEVIVKQVGAPTPSHLTYAHNIIEALPEQIRQAAHEPFGARAVMYALLLSPKEDLRERQKHRLAVQADPQVYKETLNLEPLIQQLDPAIRLPLVDMAIPILRQLSPQQYEVFKRNVTAIIPKKDSDAVFGWTLRRVLLRHLNPLFSPGHKTTTRYSSLQQVTNHCTALLSILAHRGHSEEEQAKLAFQNGQRELDLPKLILRPANRCTLTVLDLSLVTLSEATPQVKRKILKACAACIMADEIVTIEESELLRAISDSLGCPMPPLLPNISAV